MKSKSLVSTIAILLTFCTILSAQPVNNTIQDVVMPAPNAASLGKYGDIPVSLYTGVPNVSVPFYTLKSGPLSLPLALSYHASGVKVAETASWVGTGWALAAGGMISRTVLGKPDEIGYYIDASQIESVQEPYTNAQSQSLYKGVIDGEPDLFSFNLPGYSGKFIFDKNGQVKLIPKQNLKIEFEFVSSTFTSFVITTPDGVKYIFGKVPQWLASLAPGTNGVNANVYDKNVLKVAGTSGVYDTQITSWHLIKVVSHDYLHYFDLNYTDEYYSYSSPASANITIDFCTSGGGSGSSENATYGGFSDPDLEGNKHIVNVQGKRLTEIRNGLINDATEIATFVATAQREDIDVYSASGSYPGGAKRLEGISLRTGGATPAFCQEWEFNYTYFKDPGNASRSEFKKLKLLGIYPRSCDGNTQTPPYTFEYEAPLNPDNSQFLPNRFTKAIDHWGFYNGISQNNNSNSINIPPTAVNYPGTSNSIIRGTADRNTYEAPMKMGVLNKINYPTGGASLFTYEANRYTREGSSFQQDLVNITNCESLSANCCQNNGIYSWDDVTFQNEDDVFFAKFQIFVDWDDTQVVPCWNDPRLLASVDVYELTSPGVESYMGTYEFDLLYNPDGPQHAETTVLNLSVMQLVFIQGHTYRFRISALGKGQFKLWTTVYPENGIEELVGGLRVKDITHRTDANTANPATDIVRTYKYISESNPNKSSGKMIAKPVYGYTVTARFFDNSQPSTSQGYATCNRLVYSEESAVPMASFEGYHIGYERVEEILTNNGKKVYKFYAPDVAYSSTVFPNPPLLLNVRSGIELKNTAFAEGSSTAVASSELLAYNYNHSNLAGTYYRITNFAFNPYQNSPTTAYSISPYTLRTGIFQPTMVEEITDGVSKTSIHAYTPEDSAYPVLISSTFTNSDNKTYQQEYKYAFDLPVNDGMRAPLLNHFLIMPLESTLSTVNGGTKTIVGGQKTDYGLFSVSSGQRPYPIRYYKYEMTWDSTGTIQLGGDIGNGWELTGTVNSVSGSLGFPTSFTTKNWSPETYVWNSSNKMIQSRSFENFTWQYLYYANSKVVSRITDADGQFVDYFYDPLMRLSEAQARNNNARVLYTYRYKGQLGATQNFVKTESIITQVDPTNSAIGTRSAFQYLDGLGRPLQTVAQAASPSGKDIISAVAYDAQGRVIKEFTPYESTGTAGAFYDVANLLPNHPHTLKTYEASPLSRALSATPPGWYASTSSYGSNTANDGVITGYDLFSAYAPGSLFKSILTDPDGKKMITFTDRMGRMVLSRVANASGNEVADTYTQFDDKSRVLKVVPPGASHFFTPDLIFTYRYDGGDRIIAKKVPDAARSFIQYNNRDLPALSYLPKEGKWLGTQYDANGRPTQVGFVTGLANASLSANSFTLDELLSETFYDGQSGGGITRTATAIDKGRVTTSRRRILGTSNFLTSTNFYDSYGRPQTIRQNNHLLSTVTASTAAETISRTYDLADNLLTETRAHSIGTGTERTLRSRSTYDNQGRLKKSYFDPGTGSYQETGHLNYNHRNEITERNLGYYPSGDRYLQSLDYTYNVQGWLTGINQNPLGGNNNSLYFPPQLPNPGTPSTTADQNDLFCLELKYDNPLATYEIPALPQKNGNISQLWWRVRGRSAEAWGLEYDYLNRLTQAKHVAVHDGGAKIMGQYSEKITYADARGNIAAIQRYGVIPGASYPSGIIDELSFTMKPGSNQLQRIADSAPTEFAPRGFKPTAGAQNFDYTYDPVGNQTSDPHKGITITYNYLNLPSVILWSNGNKMEMSYDAMGTKLSKKVSVGATEQYTQHYLGGIEYNAVGATRKLEAIYFADGRVYNINVTTTSTTVALRYEYAIRDHLGNTRLMFADLGTTPDGVISSSEILQENHYYPFGMSMEGVWMNDAGAKDSKYLYNGKELNDDFGLGWNDYGARWYDASIARWGQIDPLAVKSQHTSAYSYAYNSPFMFIDPTGEENMIYLVFMRNDNMKLTMSHINEILRIAQRILDKAGASAKVQADFRDTPYSNEELAKRDATDRTVYISDEATLNEHFKLLSPYPGDSDSEDKIGIVNAPFYLKGFSSSDKDDKQLSDYYQKQLGAALGGSVSGDALAYIARNVIHEAFHTLSPDAQGHSNDEKGSRYGKDPGTPVGIYRTVKGDNVMLDGSGLKPPGGYNRFERFPREKRPLLFSFLWQDKEILRNFYKNRTPVDNFSKK